MKTLITVLAAAITFGIAAPTSAKADCYSGQTRIVGYTSCGTPIIAVYQITGYNAWGQPVGQWVTQPSAPYGYGGYGYGYNAQRPVVVRPSFGIGIGINPGYGHHRGYGYGNGCNSGYSRSHFGFRR